MILFNFIKIFHNGLLKYGFVKTIWGQISKEGHRFDCIVQLYIVDIRGQSLYDYKKSQLMTCCPYHKLFLWIFFSFSYRETHINKERLRLANTQKQKLQRVMENREFLSILSNHDLQKRFLCSMSLVRISLNNHPVSFDDFL